MTAGKYEDLTGQRFGRLVVIQRAGGGHRGAKWVCRCDCGGYVVMYASRLRQPKMAGCRECEYERRGAQHVIHGHSRKGAMSKLYTCWRGMVSRTGIPTDKNYPRYGGRGIKLWPAWKDFATFKDWAFANGYVDGLSIERIDPDGNYEPDNCEWIPLGENIRRMWTARSPEEQLRRRQTNWQMRKSNKRDADIKARGAAAAALLSFGA